MARQPDYRDHPNGARGSHDRPHDLADAATDRFKEVTDDVQERVGQVAEQALQYAEMAQDAVRQFKPFVHKSLKEKPMTTLASFVLVGFVLGALWKK
jgi:ElaB/YqjD/DUF883 family membrane-anchored ribosome-binding protein